MKERRREKEREGEEEEEEKRRKKKAKKGMETMILYGLYGFLDLCMVIGLFHSRV